MSAPQRNRGSDVRRAGAAYQGAFEAVFAILIGGGFGFWADSAFDWSPWGLMGGLFLGFSAFVLRLVRLGRQMQAMAEEARRDAGDG